eukprot:scaffold291025_cov18-Tisochrysis_lutea.AAC.1
MHCVAYLQPLPDFGHFLSCFRQTEAPGCHLYITELRGCWDGQGLGRCAYREQSERVRANSMQRVP